MRKQAKETEDELRKECEQSVKKLQAENTCLDQKLLSSKEELQTAIKQIEDLQSSLDSEKSLVKFHQDSLTTLQLELQKFESSHVDRSLLSQLEERLEKLQT